MDGWSSGDTLLLLRQDVHISQGWSTVCGLSNCIREEDFLLIMVVFCIGVSIKRPFYIPNIYSTAVVTSY